MKFGTKIILCFLITIFPASIGSAQSKLFPVTENGKYGFVDSTGGLVIEPQFSWASDFRNGLARVRVNNKYGFIEESGRFVIQPKYDDAEDFSEGLALVSKQYAWGFIDSKGNEAIPLQFVEALSFSDGLAAVSFQPDGIWGYIDRNGKITIPAKFFKAFSFHDGVARILSGKFGGKNLSGYIDKTGNFLIKPQFFLAGEYSEGLIPVEVGGRETKDEHIDGKWGYVDRKGKVIIPAQFNFAYEFSEGLANVIIGKKYGYIDRSGKIIIQPQFDFSSNSYRCSAFVQGRACFELGGKIGFIDQRGTVVVEPKFTFVRPFVGGFATVNFGIYDEVSSERFPIRENLGLINTAGEIIYKPINQKLSTVYKSIPVDLNVLNSWQRIQEDWFSFYAPLDIKGGKRRGIDSTIYHYENNEMQINLDIGMYSVSLPSDDSTSSMHKRTQMIDGQNATIWDFEDTTKTEYVSQIAIEFGKDTNKTHFTMTISSKTLPIKEIARDVFSSLRFKL